MSYPGNDVAILHRFCEFSRSVNMFRNTNKAIEKVAIDGWLFIENLSVEQFTTNFHIYITLFELRK